MHVACTSSISAHSPPNSQSNLMWTHIFKTLHGLCQLQSSVATGLQAQLGQQQGMTYAQQSILSSWTTAAKPAANALTKCPTRESCCCCCYQCCLASHATTPPCYSIMPEVAAQLQAHASTANIPSAYSSSYPPGDRLQQHNPNQPIAAAVSPCNTESPPCMLLPH